MSFCTELVKMYNSRTKISLFESIKVKLHDAVFDGHYEFHIQYDSQCVSKQELDELSNNLVNEGLSCSIDLVGDYWWNVVIWGWTDNT